MKATRILHITPWFPHDDDPSRAVYIERHIQSLAPFAEQHVLHMDMDDRSYSEVNSLEMTIVKVDPLFNSWRWKEWTFYRHLRKQLIVMKAKELFTHVNFHIAYPSLVFFVKLKPFLPGKICLTEHWSIYHYNFFSQKKPHRLRHLFLNDIPVITVSQSLSKDISDFAGKEIESVVIPNSVDTMVFRFKPGEIKNVFFMAALWKDPKDPIPVLHAVRDLKEEGKIVHLRIAGEGPRLAEMKKVLKENEISDQVGFLGRLSSSEIAEEMNRAKALLMPTKYETFSAVTAEALCSGCPVIGDDVGALHELIDSSNGLLRSPETDWKTMLDKFEEKVFDRHAIALKASDLYSMETVGKKYFAFLESLL